MIRIGFQVLSVIFALALQGCQITGSGWFHPVTHDYRRACGKQCVANAEQCSLSVARNNLAGESEYERARQNQELCIRRGGGLLCVPPRTFSPRPDHCGLVLDECLDACGIGLDELEAVPAPDIR